ncbi:MAG: glycosyltransferase [Eubacteriales bacterium]|nr:glycosyltransferase [Eubacteriales bacterium]
MNEPIRVLCVFSRLDRGGAETMCMNLYRHIDRSKVQFDFVKHTTDVGVYEEEIHSLGGRIYQAPRYIIYNHLSYCAWWKKHLQEHPEHLIIHGHFFTYSAVYFQIAKNMGRITIGHGHSSSLASPTLSLKIKNRLIAFYVSKIEKRADYCFACSKPAGDMIFPKKTFTILKNAIDTEKFVFSPEIRFRKRLELNYEEEHFVLGTVGRASFAKNPAGIVDIFHEVYKRNSNARFLWVGDDSGNAKAKEQARQYGILTKIIFTGVRSDVNELLQAMDVYIMPSLFEGLPVAGIEAQAAGLRCFLSDRISTEVNITDRCEFLPIEKPEVWAEAICSADWDRVDTRQQIIDAGYDIRTTAAWLEKFYLDIAKQ